MRAPDGGPIYVETNLDGLIAEPFNMLSAALFVGVAGYYAWRIRGAWREHLFLAACLPVLAVGGIGGTLYHGLRSSPVFLAMDFVPIAILCLAVAIRLWLRVLPRPIWLFAALPPFVGLRFALRDLPLATRINVGYGLLGAMILTPALAVLVRTRFAHGRFLLAAVGAFAVALACRATDSLAWLPMGSHFLWHVFGAAASCALAEYLLRLR